MNNRIGTCVMYLTNSDTIKICWYWPDTDTDTRIGAALVIGVEDVYYLKPRVGIKLSETYNHLADSIMVNSIPDF